MKINMNKESIVLGIAAAATAALTGVAGYQVGMRRTRGLYTQQINNLTAARARMAKESTELTESAKSTEAVDTSVEVVPEAVLATDNGSTTTDVAVLPVLPKINTADIQTSRREVVTEISDDITSAVYTSPGITLEEAENREIHKKAVEAALLAKAQVETPKRKTTSKEKRRKDMAAAAAAKNPLGQPEDSI